MNQDNILRLLIQAGGSISGEEMSRALGVTRAAVWKGIEALRNAGYEIASLPGQGYRLESCPNRLSVGAVSARLGRREGPTAWPLWRRSRPGAGAGGAGGSSPPRGRGCTCRCSCGRTAPRQRR